MATEAAEVLPCYQEFTKICSVSRWPVLDFDDSAVRLMRDDALDFSDVNFATTQNFRRRRLHGLYGILAVSFPSICNGNFAATESVVAGQRLPPPGMALSDPLFPHPRPSRRSKVRANFRGFAKSPRPRRRRKARKYCVFILNRGKFFCADDHHAIVRARHDQVLPDIQTVNEPGAFSRRHGVSRRIFAETCRRRKKAYPA